MCKVIAVAMAKGGVGKSVSAINLGAAFACTNKKVCIADLDPQDDATKALGFQPEACKRTIANLMYSLVDIGEFSDPDDAIITKSEFLDLIPANKKLSGVEKRLSVDDAKSGWSQDDGEISNEKVLKMLLDSLRNRYSYILVDCPPSLGALTINALTAADSVLLPLEAHHLGYEALPSILNTISLIKQRFNPSLEIEGVLITKYQDITNMCREVRELANCEYGEHIKIFNNPIPFSIKAAEQTAYGVSIFEHAKNNPVATAYMEAAKEVMSHG